MNEFQDEEAAMPYHPEESGDKAETLSSIGRAKQDHEQKLMAIDGVEGVGIGKNRIGDDAILVYLRDEEVKSRIPQQIDGFPVEIQITGKIDAY